ncbi:uncharacterized protein MCYG_06722 [Microsporum canis CBS 113480]|uniref:Uncharacterized protein n=1 Tax=Arthroderma otae (strain ATCC MYA-4605 / CBS 113480) TaxID=554155 RepID=C5FVG9_ARTOC|nr:uncharacterized protein MCYG_06722 [Microsporum canis CBS 113480]EEQ33903.1 predicted protein [Microsporum canis CBS 113480]
MLVMPIVPKQGGRDSHSPGKPGSNTPWKTTFLHGLHPGNRDHDLHRSKGGNYKNQRTSSNDSSWILRDMVGKVKSQQISFTELSRKIRRGVNMPRMRDFYMLTIKKSGIVDGRIKVSDKEDTFT